MGEHGDGMHVPQDHIIPVGITLNGEDYSTISIRCGFQGCDRSRPSCCERRELRREDDVVPERDRRQLDDLSA
jgi:hypothetical protein